MNKYEGFDRKRRQNLLIVEGNHEKNKLFRLIFKCFPELDINMDDIWIYETNIYMLYEDIVREYGSDWAENQDDIDLPFVISKKQGREQLSYKTDFVNIMLVFDYERHDPNFSKEKILEMQCYFADAADMGKLHINYPMIESYQHLCSIPDEMYSERYIPVSLQPGKFYKETVRKDTIFREMFEFEHKIDNFLHNKLDICDEQVRQVCCNAILEIAEDENLLTNLAEILRMNNDGAESEKILKQLEGWISKQRHIQKKKSYWTYIREVFVQIVLHNIRKANRVQNGTYQIEENRYKEVFERLDEVEILKVQNTVSQDKINGYIWILNTCIFFIAEYNSSLIFK